MKKSQGSTAFVEDKPKKEKNSPAGIVMTILGIVFCVILLPILILNIILIVQGLGADKSQLPSIGGYFPLMVQSGSMSGTIETGDLIIVHTVDQTASEEMKQGDVVTFWENQPGGALVTHRIDSVTADEKGALAYVTRGDANPAADTRYLYPDKIVGVYVTRFAGLGNVAMFMQTIPGLIICVVLPLAAFIAYDIIRRKRIDKSTKKENAALLAELEELKRLQAEQNASAGEKEKAPKTEDAPQETSQAEEKPDEVSKDGN